MRGEYWIGAGDLPSAGRFLVVIRNKGSKGKRRISPAARSRTKRPKRASSPPRQRQSDNAPPSERAPDSERDRIRLRTGSRVTRFKLGVDELAVLSFPISPPTLPAGITSAEREVVRLLLQGMTNSEIAKQRNTSARTVANQIASVFRKLGVSSRSELVGLLSGG